ncbi:SDR family oxidoreductase [Ancylobacter terrae]|uniref:SDR family oxidoreductase n=1 Tax=Ancylobacter sp. sgz301288 TaxID=3342077 RepID=UPI00385AA34C
MAGRILVLGARGTVGTPLVAALLAKGEKVRAASRSGAAVAGAESVAFDYADPATHAAAFDGVDRAYVLLPTGHTNVKELLAPVIAAAAARGVKVVLQTALGVDADDSIPYRQVELALEASGVPFVILRPNWFADNFHTFWKPGIDHGVIALPAGEGRTSFIDARDIAASAAAALTEARFEGRAFNLTGPEALSYGQAAAILAEVAGKPIAYTPIDDAAFVAMLTGAGVPADYAGFLATIFHPVREGWAAGVTGDVEALTGAPPRPLATYARDHAALFRG